MKYRDELRFFLVVAKIGDPAVSADELVLNVIALPRRLKFFEEEFQISLFEKGSRSYQPINTGEELLSYAAEVEDSIFSVFQTVVGQDQHAAEKSCITY
jgi:DNA-binding transcriptional LysR family regulator